MVLLPNKLQSSFTETGKKRTPVHWCSTNKVTQVWSVWVNDDHFHLWVNYSLNISALCSLCLNVSVSKANLAASPSLCSTVRRANWYRQCERTDTTLPSISKHRPQHVPCLSLSLNNPSPFTPPSEEEDLDPPFLPSSSLILSQLEAAKRNRNAEYSMLTFLTIRSYHKDVELTSVNMLNCLYVSLACLSCMYNNV